MDDRHIIVGEQSVRIVQKVGTKVVAFGWSMRRSHSRGSHILKVSHAHAPDCQPHECDHRSDESLCAHERPQAAHS